MISLIAIVSGVLSVLLFGHDEKLLKKESSSFKYTREYCRSNLHHFYFNDSDCNCIAKALEIDKYLEAELNTLLKYHNFEDSVQILINQHKITL